MRKTPTLSFLEPRVPAGEELNYYRKRGTIWGKKCLLVSKDLDEILEFKNLPDIPQWTVIWLGDDWISEVYTYKKFYLIKLKSDFWILEIE